MRRSRLFNAMTATLLGLAPANAQAPVTADEAYAIGVEVYVYVYPLVTMDITRRVMTNVEAGRRPGAGPMNAFHHLRAFPGGANKVVVRPNFDTLYSIAWLDITREPMIVSAPDTRGRYYLLPMMDMWTDVFASPGKRTTGTAAGRYAVVPAGWHGTLPPGVERIDAPTPHVWIIGRTQTNGPGDYPAVHQVQDGFAVTPLSRSGEPAAPVAAIVDPDVDMRTPPLHQVNSMPALAYFKYAAELMKANPPHVTDQAQLARMRRIGLEPGRSFDPEKLSPEVQAALVRAAADGIKTMRARLPALGRPINGWRMTADAIGVYGNAYLRRAIVTMTGLGALAPEDAVYPSSELDADGRPYDGNARYVLHFDQAELPPVGAFWSLTLYDRDGFPVPNDANRFAVGDRDPLIYNPDGSLDIYVQHDNPGADKSSNWLPAPRDAFNLTLRLYAPKASVLEGRWRPPGVRRLE